MRKRKLFIGALLAFAIAFLGIGYAAVASRTLTVNGTAAATADDSAFDVKFTGTPTADTTHGGSHEDLAASGAISSDRVATMTVEGMTTKGQYVTVTYTITNNSAELSAKLKTNGITVTNVTGTAATYMQVTAELANPSATIAHGQSTTLTVKVEMIKTPTTDITATSFTVAVEFEPVEVA